MYEADHEIRNIENALLGRTLTRRFTTKRGENYAEWESGVDWTGKVLTCTYDRTKGCYMLIIAGRGEYFQLNPMAARMLLMNRCITDGEVKNTYMITLDTESQATANVYKLVGERVEIGCELSLQGEAVWRRKASISNVSVDNALGIVTLLLAYNGLGDLRPLALDLANAERLWEGDEVDVWYELGKFEGISVRRVTDNVK